MPFTRALGFSGFVFSIVTAFERTRRSTARWKKNQMTPTAEVLLRHMKGDRANSSLPGVDDMV
ncbi:hypothetical protein EYF80_004422 [Liparis tanakae]|uniref:Uncharacterized protein n=1 Tax=Liparis tanakae TaxID=230148 RepID=A0A4Z2J5E3_9TELE|nr:hypothetical protein EYF80_004422 [Liparis tanakae]